MEEGSSPRAVTSTRRIKYRRSEWIIHEFEVWSGGVVCRAATLRVAGSLLVWVGGTAARLAHVALGMPATGSRHGPAPVALATPLMGDGEGAVALARRLAAALSRPVYVCCGATFDRFTMPLVEHALLSQIKTRLYNV